MPSIEQNAPSDSPPDFRNLGVALRILPPGNITGFTTALIRSRGTGQLAQRYRRQS